MSAINGIIQGGASIISSLIAARAASESNKQAARIAKETREFNKEQNDIKYQRDKEMWHAANAYNSPLAQRQRFEEAGINPFLALGRFDSGTASALQSPTPTPASDYGYQSPLGHLAEGIAGAGQSYLQAKLTQAQIDNVNANTKKTLADAEGQGITNSYLSKDIEARIAEVQSREGLNRAQAALTLFQKEHLGPAQVRQMDKTVEKITSDIALNSKELDLKTYDLDHIKPAEKALLDGQLQKIGGELMHLAAMTGLSYAEIAKIDLEKMILNDEIDMRNLSFDSRLKKYMADYLQSFSSSQVNFANAKVIPKDHIIRALQLRLNSTEVHAGIMIDLLSMLFTLGLASSGGKKK